MNILSPSVSAIVRAIGSFAPSNTGGQILQIAYISGLLPKNGGYPIALSFDDDEVVISTHDIDLNTLDEILSNAATILALPDAFNFPETNIAFAIVDTAGLLANNGGYPLDPLSPSVESTDTSSTTTLATPISPVSSEGRIVTPYSFIPTPTEMIGILQFGMSNTMGGGTSPTLTDAVSAYAYLYMLGSIRYNDSGAASPGGWPATWAANNPTQWGSSINAVQEGVINGYANTGMVQFGNALLAHLSSHLGFNLENTAVPFLLGNSAAGGRRLDEMMSPGAYWVQTTNWLSYFAARATGLGYTSRLAVALLDDGGQDTTVGTNDSTYYNLLITLPAMLQSAAASAGLANQTVYVGIEQESLSASYDVGSGLERKAWLIEIAQAKVAVQGSMFVTGVGYSETYMPDGRHMTGVSQDRKRAHNASKVGQLLAKGILPTHPYAQTVRWTSTGATVTIGGNVGDMVIDSSFIYDPPGFNHGFAVHNGSDTPILITSVTQLSGNQFFIETGVSLASGTRLSYGRCSAINGVLGGSSAGGPIYGARGSLRDQAGEHPLNRVTINGTVNKLHNWLTRFEAVKP